jgi:ACR3 family arsenite transporter
VLQLWHLPIRSFDTIGGAMISQVNLPITVLVWMMIIPMLIKVDFGTIRMVRRHWPGVGISLLINWAIKPCLMMLLGWLFIGLLFAPYLSVRQIDGYIAGLILLASAPCSAMVFAWSNLANGSSEFTRALFAFNNATMLIAYAPIVVLLLGLSGISVPSATLLLSVGLYVVLPVVIAQIIRRRALRLGPAALDALLIRLRPISLIALVITLVLLLDFHGDQIISDPMIIALLAVPILIQVYLNFGLAYFSSRLMGQAHCVASPAALISASNCFELTVAFATSIFGVSSGAVLTTLVAALVEVPVMLSLVKIANSSKRWYESAQAPGGRPDRP